MSEKDISWEADRKRFVGISDAEKAPFRDRVSFINDTYPNVKVREGGGRGGGCGKGAARMRGRSNALPTPHPPHTPQDITDEHFIVWMRPAALPNFRKLYGRIEKDVPVGTVLTFRVDATFQVSSFAGKKALVISTTSVIGGKNPFLGIAYVVVGAICLTLALLFAVRTKIGGRKLGDTSYLVWPGK